MEWQQRLRHPIRALRARFRRRPKKGVWLLGRGIVYAALVGVVAGVGAIIFHLLCVVISHYGLVSWVGYAPGGPANETRLPLLMPEGAGHGTAFNPLLLLVLLTAGGAVSGMIVYGLAPEAEGHGTDAAIDAYHNRRGVIRWQVPLVKTLASAITLGTGGSGGREGPIAQIGAGFGSFLGTHLGLPEAQRRTLLAAGVGAGIGAIFHAPLAGAIFAIEVLYLDPDFEAEGLIPAFIATTVAYSLFSFVFGEKAFSPLFEVATELNYTRPFVLLLPLAALAVLMTVAAQIYVRVFYGTQHLFRKLPLPPMVKPAIGALLAGVVAVGLYYGFAAYGPEAQHQSLGVLYVGYGFLQKVLAPEGGAIFAMVLLAVGLGKILTTALTIGSGGSGGVFGPSMVIGGSLGGLVGVLFHQAIPGIVHEPDVVVFAILGMASFFAAAAKTPVSTLIMVSELTGGYALLPPAMWVCALAYIISGKRSLYREQKRSRLDSPAHRGDFIVDILKGLTVKDALPEDGRRFETVRESMPLSDLGDLITRTMQATFPVVNGDGSYTGLFGLNDVRRYLYDTDLGMVAIAQDVASDVEPLTPDMDLSDALSRFAQGRFEELPVVEGPSSDRVVGMLRRQDLIGEYERQLLQIQEA